jgi:cytochrome b
MSTKTNFLLDLGIFAGSLIALEPALTGMAVHEWFSLALGLALAVHLLLHWDWVVQVTLQFFRKPLHISRLNYVLNVLLFITFTGVMLSGLMISKSVLPALGLQAGGGAWRGLHRTFTDLVLIVVGLHFALHWKWIVNSVKRFLLAPLAGRPRSQASNPQAQRPAVVLEKK